MDRRARELHEQTIVVDGHDHFMRELVRRRNMGDKAVFLNDFAPIVRRSSINVIVTCVGGDNTCLTNNSDLMLWGSLWIMDMLWQEVEESNDIMAICLNAGDIDAALTEGKIALLLQLEGGRPLEGKPNLETLVGLRTFYRQGVRVLQLVDNGRNRIGDGKGEIRTKGGLTNFGISVVKEMNRLGMLIDVAHLSEPGFWDVMETSTDPIIDSHSNAKTVCDHVRNITDEQIKAIAKKGGVIGLSCFKALIGKENSELTIDDLIKHLDHIAGWVGVDYVGFGPDFNGFEEEIITDIWTTPGSGWLEGVFYGSGSHRIAGVDSITAFPRFTEALVKRGYSDEEIKKVLGENFLRVFRQVLR